MFRGGYTGGTKCSHRFMRNTHTGRAKFAFFVRCSLSSVYFIPSTPSAPLFRTTCRYALLRLSLDSICSIRLLVPKGYGMSMRSFLSASLDLTIFTPIGYGSFSPYIRRIYSATTNVVVIRLRCFVPTYLSQPSLVCDFYPSDQRFAYSFLQIPPHDEHPCCSAIHFPLPGHVRDFIMVS